MGHFNVGSVRERARVHTGGVNEHLALGIANTPLAIIMLMELPDHFALVAERDDTVEGSVTPEMLAVSIDLVERHCPASPTLSSREVHAAIDEQLTMLEPGPH